MLEVLDAVEADCEGSAGLVLAGEGKFFNNGLNVEVIMALKGDDMRRFGESMGQILGRLLLAPLPTVAAVNGHAFAAGAFLALVCDYRIMREDRGWFCISEVDAGVSIDLIAEAKKLAGSIASKERRIFRTLKRTLYGNIGKGLGVG